MVSLTALLLIALAGVAVASQRFPVDIQQFPCIVQVESLNANTLTWSLSCAASILNSRYVLSAAHCFDGPFYSPQARRIRAGATRSGLGGQLVGVLSANNHPSYNTQNTDGDISVVFTATPFIYGAEVAQCGIVPQGWATPPNVSILNVGWRTQGVENESLLATSVSTISSDLCIGAYQNQSVPISITENAICAQNNNGDCLNDAAGSQLVITNVVIGVLAWGEGCGASSLPAVATAVSAYTNWIVAAAS